VNLSVEAKLLCEEYCRLTVFVFLLSLYALLKELISNTNGIVKCEKSVKVLLLVLVSVAELYFSKCLELK